VIFVYSQLVSPWLFRPPDSISVCCHQGSKIRYIWMPSPIYQNMVNLIVSFPIWRRPSIFMDVAMWEHHTFDSDVFRCGRVY
jgi:hypothetical protein